MREFHDILTLISYGDPVRDEWGNRIRPEELKAVLCAVGSVTRTEFYQASTVGLKPAYTVYVHIFEYDGEKLAELYGDRYQITRTYVTEIDGIHYLELQLSERIGDQL